MQTDLIRYVLCALPLLGALFSVPRSDPPTAKISASCETNSEFQTARLGQIRRAVHPIQDPADSAALYRQATRLPPVDSALVTLVTSDSLCAVAAGRYGIARFADSTRVSSVTLIRLGDSGYVAMGVEGEIDMVGEIFLFFTPSWTWRGGSVRPN